VATLTDRKNQVTTHTYDAVEEMKCGWDMLARI
jgi:hypothetical protein